MKNTIDVVFSTCERYWFLKDSFLKRFQQHFKDFKGKIYTNVYSNDPNFIGISRSCSSADFSTRLIEILKHIKSEYILFFWMTFF